MPGQLAGHDAVPALRRGGSLIESDLEVFRADIGFNGNSRRTLVRFGVSYEVEQIGRSVAGLFRVYLPG